MLSFLIWSIDWHPTMISKYSPSPILADFANSRPRQEINEVQTQESHEIMGLDDGVNEQCDDEAGNGSLEKRKLQQVSTHQTRVRQVDDPKWKCRWIERAVCRIILEFPVDFGASIHQCELKASHWWKDRQSICDMNCSNSIINQPPNWWNEKETLNQDCSWSWT